MKPFPTDNFPISVRKQIWEEDPNSAVFYQNIFDVRLNFSVSIMFIPTLCQKLQSGWIPVLPDNVDDISTELEARLVTAALSQYVVTPDRKLAGTEIALKNNMLQGKNTSVFFYVTPEEFEIFILELSNLADKFPFVHDSCEVSIISNLEFVKLIRSRIIPSKYFAQEDSYILGSSALKYS